jgi:hypothetical protein
MRLPSERTFDRQLVFCKDSNGESRSVPLPDHSPANSLGLISAFAGQEPIHVINESATPIFANLVSLIATSVCYALFQREIWKAVLEGSSPARQRADLRVLVLDVDGYR